MALDTQTISLAIGIVALCMTLYLYRKTNIELQDLKDRQPILQMAPGPMCIDDKCEIEKSKPEVKEEKEDEA